MIEVARRMGFEQAVPVDRADTYIEQIWEEYRRFHAGPGTDGRPTRSCGAAGRDLAVRERQGDAVALQRRHDPPPTKPAAFDFYGKPDQRAWIWLRPYEPPPEVAGRGLSLLAQHRRASSSTGTAAR